MSPSIQRKAQLICVTGGVVSILLALFCLTMIQSSPLNAASNQVRPSATQQTGVITGQVTTEDSGAPLSGIEVVAFPREIADQQSVTAMTDATGHYELQGLRAGNYKVCFGPFQIDERFLSECYANRALEDEPEQLVTVTEGETLPNINAVLTLGGMIQGRVTSGRTGLPLPNIPVDAIRLNGISYNRSTQTDASGYYTITTLPTANYRVRFNGDADGNRMYAFEYFDDQTSEEASTPVSVTAGMTTSDIDAELTFNLNITGRIEYQGNYHRQFSLEITVYDAAGEVVQRPLAASNEYSITGLAPGAYRLRFGEQEFVNEYYVDSPTFEAATWITVTPNTVVSNVNVSLVALPESDLTLATATTRPDAILAARSGEFGAIFTLDGGESWQPFATKPIDPFQNLSQLAVAPRDDAERPVRFMVTPNATTSPVPGAFYRTGDGGASWANFVPASDPRCDTDALNVVDALVSSAPDPQRFFALVRCVKTIGALEPAYIYYTTLYFGSDGGVNWQAVTSPVAENGSSRYPFPSGEVPLQTSPNFAPRLYAKLEVVPDIHAWRRSDTNGESWITETFTVTTLALDWTDDEKLYGVEDAKGSNVARYTGVRSTDLGATWQDWPQQPCRTSFLQLITLPTANTLLMLCNQGLLRSEDGGDSWELLTTDTGGKLSVHYGDRDLILWVRGTELYTSSDQGTTWQALDTWHDAYLPSAHRP